MSYVAGRCVPAQLIFLEPNAYFTCHQVNINVFRIVLYDSHKISITALCNIKTWDCITEGVCVYCAVRSEYLNIIQAAFFFNSLI